MSILSKNSLSRASTFLRNKKAAKVLANRALASAAAVGAAAGYGAYKINKASNALNKSIASQHTKSSMDDHQRMLNRAQARKKAAASLIKAKQPKAKQGLPGGPDTPGVNYNLWR